MTAFLRIRGLGKSFGGVRALSGVDLDVAEGEIVSVIGPNGAGKTTLFNLLTGMLPPSEGSISFRGEDLLTRRAGVRLPFVPPARRSVAEVTRAGIARTFQNIRLFPEMTALENVMVTVETAARYGLLDILLATSRQAEEAAAARRSSRELLAFCGIGRLESHLAKSLSYGDQRRLEIARALGARPRLLLLDEPAAGMNPTEQAAIKRLIGQVRDLGVTILLIEHEMRIVMEISDRIAVLDFGRKIAEGSASEIQRDTRVVQAYLGAPGGKPARAPAKTAEAAATASPLLELKGLHVNYGAVEAIKGVDLRVDQGEIVCLIGSNGAGKTTILKTISGLRSPARGTILFQGERIDGLGPHKLVRRGIAHSPEGRRVLSRMSVVENLQLAYREATSERTAASEKESLDRVFALLPLLGERARSAGGSLSGGQQQMLAIGRAVIGAPALLMLDEPSMGLAPMMTERIFSIIRDINRLGTTILLVEQNANMALSIASRGYVIESGRIVLADSCDRLLGNDQVRRAYLGEALEGELHA
jgi:branched-chain amino acid transport system ATP-binding protein